MNIDDRPTRSSSAVDALSAAVGRPADRDEETTRQVAQLAAWEDEGGAKHCGKTAL